METSLNNAITIEQYLIKKLSAEDALLFEATLIIDPVLRINVAAQQRLYKLIKLYGRRKLKEELNTVHHRVFNDPANKYYGDEILELFKPKTN